MDASRWRPARASAWARLASDCRWPGRVAQRIPPDPDCSLAVSPSVEGEREVVHYVRVRGRQGQSVPVGFDCGVELTAQAMQVARLKMRVRKPRIELDGAAQCRFCGGRIALPQSAPEQRPRSRIVLTKRDCLPALRFGRCRVPALPSLERCVEHCQTIRLVRWIVHLSRANDRVNEPSVRGPGGFGGYPDTRSPHRRRLPCFPDGILPESTRVAPPPTNRET